MRLLVAALLGASPIFFAPTLNAQSLAHCSNCDGDSVELVASRAPSGLGVFDVVVLDYTRETVWTCTTRREARTRYADATCTPAPASAQADFAVIAKTVQQLDGDIISIPHPGGNIYDISGCPSCARNWLYTNRHAVARQASLLNLLSANGLKLAGNLGIKFADLQMSYEGQARVLVEMSNDRGATDQGKAYCIAAITNTEIVIDVNQCFDGDGNPIPTLQNNALQMRYTFSNGVNYGGFVGRLSAIGYPVHGAGVVTVGGVIDCRAKECEGREKQ
jgi:hypothetical protein